MPLYEYECEQCGARFEVIQRFSDPAIETCRACGGPVHKLISPPAIQFKGTGWYITDYARKNGGTPATTPPPSASSGSEAKSNGAGSSTTSGASSDSGASKKD